MTTKIPASMLLDRLVFGAKEKGALGNGAAIDGPAIQLALNEASAAGGGTVILGPGTYLLDNPLLIPARVRLTGTSRNGTVLKAVGRDTHGRNSAIFSMFAGVSTTNNPCMVSLEGDDAELCNLRIDGNGTQNYAFNAATGVNDYLDESTTLRHGICGARVGGLYQRANVSVALRTIRRAKIVDVDFFNCSWGGAQLNGAVMNSVEGQAVAEDSLFGLIDCAIEGCHFENCHSNVLQVNGCVNFRVERNTFISPWHAAVKVYMRARGGQIDRNTVHCDEARALIWDLRDATVAAVRERELSTRSEMICVGHSDYDREIRDVSVTNNRVYGNNVGVRHGITVYGRCKDILVSGNLVTGVIHPVSFTFPESLTIVNNRLRSHSYTTAHISAGTQYGGADIILWPRDGEVTKTLVGDTCRIDIIGNSLQGAGVSNFRISNWTNFDDQSYKPRIRFEGNVCDHTALASLGATARAPIGVFNTPSAGGSVVLKDNTHVDGTAEPTYANTYTISSVVTVRDTFSGSFTPTVRGSTAAGAGTYTSQSGTYTITNGRCHFELQVAWSAHTGTGNLWVEGLPIVAKASIPTVALAVMHSGLAAGAGLQLAAQIPAGEARIYTFGLGNDAAATAVPLDTAVTMLRIAGSYPV